MFLVIAYVDTYYLYIPNTRTIYLFQRSFIYKVKIINPQRKSDVVVKQLHQVQSKFDSVIDLRVKLVKELQQKVLI